MTVRTRAELEAIFATLGYAHITPANMRDFLESVPLIDEVGGVVLGPELMTEESSTFIGDSQGDWIAPNGGDVFVNNESAVLHPFAQSTYVMEFFAADAADFMQCTLTGVTLEAGHTYAVFALFDFDNTIDVTVSLNAVAIANYDFNPNANIVYEWFPLMGYYTPGSPVANPVLKVQQDFADTDRFSVSYVSVREVIKHTPILGPVTIATGDHTWRFQDSTAGRTDDDFENGLNVYTGVQGSSQIKYSGAVDYAGAMVVDHGINATGVQWQRKIAVADTQNTTTTLASITSATGGGFGFAVNSNHLTEINDSGFAARFRHRFGLWVLTDSATVGVKFGFSAGGNTFAFFKGTVIAFDTTMTRVAGGVFTAVTDVIGFGLAAGTFYVEIEVAFDFTAFGGNLELQFAQNAAGGAEGVHIQPGSWATMDSLFR